MGIDEDGIRRVTPGDVDFHRPYLAEKCRVAGLGLRGHGRSGMPESRDFCLERFAEGLKAAVDAFE